MRDRRRTNQELIREVRALRQRIAELEASETRRELAEEEARRRASVLQSIFQAFPDLCFRLGSDGTILDYNAGQTSYLYLPPETFMGKRMQEVLPPGVGRQFQDAIDQVLRSKSLVSIEYSLPMPGGERSYEARLLLIPENEIIVIVRDMTDRKEAERKLRESEQRYRTLFEESRDAIYITTRTGEFIDVNGSTVELLGYEKDEMIGMNAREIYARASDREKFREEIEQKKSVRDYEVRFRRKDGTEIDCLLTAAVRYDQDGNIVGYQGIIRDITEQKRTDEEIRRLNEDLRRRAEELKVANKNLEAFVYTISHDLRTPLVVIGGFSRMLIEKYGRDLEPKGQHFLTLIQSNAQNMVELIDDLLAFSRIESQKIKWSNIDMGDLARTTFEELRGLASGRTLELRLEGPPPARGDRTMIRQVLTNLLSNAIKFTRSRRMGLIRIGGMVEGNRNVYYVRDNGVGFDMRYADDLFGLFRRFHDQEGFEGTGVGLAIVQHIIQRHGGQVWAEGKVDEGATFYFTLPREGSLP